MATQKKWKFPKDAAAFRLESRKAWEYDRVEPLRQAMAEYEAGALTYEQLAWRLRSATPTTGEIVALPSRRPWWRVW